MYYYLILSGLLVWADYAIKVWAQGVLKPVGSIDIIPGILSLYYHENFGAAWGILQGKRWLLLVVTIAVILGLIGAMLMKKFKGHLLNLSMALIIAGGVGNIIDRIIHTGGFVVDYIYFEPINFPIFNLADICVCVGTVLFALYIFFVDGKKAAAPELPQQDPEP